MRIIKNILLSFDLDNTLIDNRKGIVNSFNYALNKFNIPELEKTQIEYMIGIPLIEMFERVTNQDSSQLITAFREYYSKQGIYQGSILPGVESKLKELYKLSFTLGIITSKKQELAVKIVKILKIKKFFDYVIGETEDTKELGKLDPKLKTYMDKNYPEHQIVIIGDHPKDVMLSNNLNCPFIGVLTGNHTRKELIEIKIGKIEILNSVSELTTDLIYSLF
ncbi:MAG: HAD family hydrolase [Promethearchaeota archaeon]